MRNAIQIIVEILGVASLAALVWMGMFLLLYLAKEDEVENKMRNCISRVHSIPVGTEPVPVASKEIWDYCVKEVSR